MSQLKPLFYVLAVLAVVFILSSCDGDKTSETPTYTVMVPQFAEGNSKDSKVGIPITQEMIVNDTTVRRFFAYRVAPPITGFKEQKIAKGSRVSTSIFGNPISLAMDIDEEENFVFEGLRDSSEYIKVVISKDNKTFSYVHSMILNVTQGDDEFDVVVGAGEILSSNHFDSYGTAYYLSAGGDAARYKFLLHGKEGGKMAWLCYEGKKQESQESPGEFTDAEIYDGQCVTKVNDRVDGVSDSNFYVAAFDKNGLDFSSLSVVTPENYIADSSVLSDSEVIGLCSLAGIQIAKPITSGVISGLRTTIKTNLGDNGFHDNFSYLYILTTNGLGKAFPNLDACKTTINSWNGFNSWNINDSLNHWFPST